MGYADGYLVPVPDDNKEAYRAMAAKAAAIFKDHGAIRVVEAWGDDVPDGKVTDYKGAVKADGDENVVYLLGRMAVEGGPRRGLEEGDGRSAHAART